ncbi:MAG: Two component transcriptional regulator, winged helix family [Candidatus Daviesbacteria bacterium GW2011_GWA1_41_61]|nr:MAG: Two component transcriptional regulator, winged helix family [Candidatus Daviesbacteria bacterium GW2011_GWA1_41_61]
MFTSTPTSSPGKILIVDDDDDIRNIYKDYLTANGFKVELATNGQEGLSKILQGGYDLILLDIMMPKIDGLGILRRLKEKPLNQNVYNGPIVVLSALRQDEVYNEALRLGAKGYIVKSDITPKDLLDKVVELLKKP